MTNKRTSCGCLFSLLPCLNTLNSEDVISKQHNKAINRQIAKEKKEFRETHRLLLLGAGESGKSTIIKQMQLIHVEKFSDIIRQQRRNDIRNNLAEAIVSILNAMISMTPPIEVDNLDHETKARWILNHANKTDLVFREEFYTYTKHLWKDKGVQRAFERSNEYQLIDCAKYFLDKVDVISKDDYIPTDQDILRCRILTSGIYELTFQIKKINFQVIDVGGQRDERRKWFLCFNGITAIIFVAACSSYNMVLREDPSKNRLEESLELFKTVWNNRWLDEIPIILFLNKQDLFKEKVLSGRSPVQNYFPAFKNFENFEPEPGEHHEVLRAKYFIKRQFEEICEKNINNNNKKKNNDNKSKNDMARLCYSHFTCAVDTENIKRVFDSCRNHIQRQHLLDNNLL